MKTNFPTETVVHLQGQTKLFWILDIEKHWTFSVFLRFDQDLALKLSMLKTLFP